MVLKFIIMKIFYYILLLSCLFSERGDVFSVELLEYRTAEEIQLEIDSDLGGQGVSGRARARGRGARRSPTTNWSLSSGGRGRRPR